MVEAFEYQKAGMRMQIILLKKLYFGKHFIDIINENIVEVLKWYLICSSIRVFQINYILWKKFKLDITEAKLSLTLTCQILVIY